MQHATLFFGNFHPIWWKKLTCGWFHLIAVFAEKISIRERYFCLDCNFSQSFKLVLLKSLKEFRQTFEKLKEVYQKQVRPFADAVIAKKLHLRYFKFILTKIENYVKHIFTFCRSYRSPFQFSRHLTTFSKSGKHYLFYEAFVDSIFHWS